MINLHLFSYLTFHAVLVVSYFTQYYTGKYGPETTPYLDTFHAVLVTMNARTKDVIRKLNTWSVYVGIIHLLSGQILIQS